MFQSSQAKISNAEEQQWSNVCKLGGAASLLQLGSILLSVIGALIFGAEPETTAEYFTAFQNDRLAALIRLDFATVLLLCLSLFTSFGIYAALRGSSRPYAALGIGMVFTGVILALANHSAFSMIRLSDLYAAATSAAQREQLLATGEAIIASNMWNSTSGFLAGIFMQGGFVFLSVVMLKSKAFSKGTAYTGLLANGLDMAHVFVALFSPFMGEAMLYVGGLFYLMWFPLLGRDLIRLGRSVLPAYLWTAQPAS